MRMNSVIARLYISFPLFKRMKLSAPKSAIETPGYCEEKRLMIPASAREQR